RPAELNASANTSGVIRLALGVETTAESTSDVPFGRPYHPNPTTDTTTVRARRPNDGAVRPPAIPAVTTTAIPTAAGPRVLVLSRRARFRCNHSVVARRSTALARSGADSRSSAHAVNVLVARQTPRGVLNIARHQYAGTRTAWNATMCAT